MGRHRLRHEYARASLIATMVFNMHRDPRKARALGTNELNPYSEVSGIASRGTSAGTSGVRVATKSDFDRLRKLCGKG